ncbi:restriction endonuclease subunit S [Cryptosporangium arvum]|uniref:restriction endonuclease subunit S n=1 Tax=Cryptosporangium arvum TaxID=80871 RepID=UPI0004BBC1D5|nr:restriction endonuclease subunit S [Cryptosporangium arvum]
MTTGLAGLDLPAGWQWWPLKHAALAVNRGSAPDYVDDGPVWAVSQAVNQPHRLDWDRARFHGGSRAAGLKGLLAPEDILINSTGRGTLGRVGYFSKSPDDRPAMADGHVTRVRTDKRVLHPRFAFHYFSSEPFQHYIYSALIVGATNQIELVGERLDSAPVMIPPIEEQRRIADFLDAETRLIDATRSARSRMIKLLELKRDRLVDEHVTGGQDVGGFVPLKYLVSSVSVGIVITPAAWYVESGGVPALRGLNVKPGKITTSDLVQISHEGHSLHRKSRLAAGDLVVVRTGQAGAAAVVPPELDGINCIDLVIVRPGSAFVPRFAEYLLNSSYAKRRVSEFSVGSIQAHFNVAAMKAMPVPRYSIAEQKRRVDAIEEATRRIEWAVARMREQDRLLAERRQALITAAVTGQIDVTTGRGVD